MYNKAIIVGRLTADPELKQTPNGVSVATFTVAVDRPYTAKGKTREVDFLDVVAWRTTAEFVCKYFRKGNPILIDGAVQTRQYTDKQGNNRRVWEIVANSVNFVGGKETGTKQNDEPVDEPDETYSDDGDLPF